MADISKLSRLIDGFQKNVDLAANTLVVDKVKVGGGSGTDLTKTILDNLITLQNGSDIANTVHHHDGRYFTESELGAQTNGASGASLIGIDVTPAFSNFTSGNSVQSALEGIDSALATVGITSFLDSTFEVKDSVDTTKKLKFEVSGVGTGTTKTITMPNADVNLGALTNSNIDAAADIDYSKLADLSGFTGNILVQNGSGKIGVGGYLESELVTTDGAHAMAADLDMGTSFKVKNLAAGSANTDAVNKLQMDNADALKVTKAGDTMSGNLAMGLNKVTGIANGTNANDAVNKAQLDAISVGLVWKNPIALSNLIGTDETSPVGSPISPDAYIIGTGGNTGAWSSFAVGDVVQYQNSSWILIKAAAVGDRFGISFQTATAGAGDALGKDNYIGTISGGTAGAWTWTWEAPVANNAVFVSNPNAYLFGHSYVYVSATSSWTEFSGPTATGAGIGLAYDGNTLNINLGAGIAQLPSDEVGVDVHANGGLMTTVDNSSSSTVTGSQLAVKLDGSTLAKGASGLKVASGGISNTEINASAAIAYSKLNLSASIVNADVATGAAIALNKLATVTASRALVSDGSGNISASAVTSADLTTLTDGSNADSLHVHSKLMINGLAGESMAADTTFGVRLALNGETAGRFYKTDSDANSVNKFFAIGLVMSTSLKTAGDSINIVKEGLHTLGASDTPFSSSDIGKPVFLTTSGALSVTAPVTSGHANYIVGIVISTTTIMVGNKQLTGIV